MISREQFLNHLRDALNHLRDPDRLRKSPLASLFGVAERSDTFAALQKILVEAIASLEPDPNEPPQSRAWRIHDTLLYRYVEGSSPQEVAHQLGIGVRHLRREQRAAQEALAHLLWHEFQLGSTLPAHASIGEVTDNESILPPTPSDELAWLRDSAPQGGTDTDQIVGDVLELARVLAAKHHVILAATVPEVLPKVSAHPVALNQALLSLAGIAIRLASGGRSRLVVSATPRLVQIRIDAGGKVLDPGTFSESDVSSLDMARRLVELCGGRLELSDENERFSANVTLAAIDQVSVLAIDDNADTLQLWQRYTSSTRYRVVGTRDARQAIELAERLEPQIIVLDVMMPQIDGWKVLGMLRQHPRTRQLPIVVCTIVAQEDLALALGASAFIKKPVSQQAFLSVLDAQVPQVLAASHQGS
jgi:CheY-like chemotaxis protein